MLTSEKILALAQRGQKVETQALVKQYRVSRQYVNRLILDLTRSGQLVKIGTTRSSHYVSPDQLSKQSALNTFQKTYANRQLEEHVILNELEHSFFPLTHLPDNIKSIFTYAFSEMLNNAIEHSQSPRISLELKLANKILTFVITDQGIGVFRNIRTKKKLTSEFEAIQELLKGKTTTMPKSHSGEGIFFTSKVSDLFVLDSYGYELLINNHLPDVFAQKTKHELQGTRVTFQISVSSPKHLNDIFQRYTRLDDNEQAGFDKTEIHVKLYTLSGIHISRSQARRILTGLEKFKVVTLDFEGVPLVGQAFADEIFRVWHHRYPHIKLENINMNEGVDFMIKRAITEANKA